MTIIIPTDLVQGSSRFRNDDGNEITATWKAAQGANVVFGVSDLDVNFRLRIPTSWNTDPPASTTFQPQLQYILNGAGQFDVNGSSSVVRSFLSPNITEDEVTTKQLSGDPLSFVAGAMDEVDGICPSFTLDDEEHSEHEFVLRVRSVDVVNGDRIELLLVKAPSTSYDVYINIPAIDIVLINTPQKSGFMQFFSEVP